MGKFLQDEVYDSIFQNPFKTSITKWFLYIFKFTSYNITIKRDFYFLVLAFLAKFITVDIKHCDRRELKKKNPQQNEEIIPSPTSLSSLRCQFAKSVTDVTFNLSLLRGKAPFISPLLIQASYTRVAEVDALYFIRSDDCWEMFTLSLAYQCGMHPCVGTVQDDR